MEHYENKQTLFSTTRGKSARSDRNFPLVNYLRLTSAPPGSAVPKLRLVIYNVRQDKRQVALNVLQILALAKFSDFLVKTQQAKKFCPASHANGARASLLKEYYHHQSTHSRHWINGRAFRFLFCPTCLASLAAQRYSMIENNNLGEGCSGLSWESRAPSSVCRTN